MARHSQGGMAQHDVAWHSWDGWGGTAWHSWGGTAQLWHGVAWHSVAGVAWHSMSRRPHVTGRGTHLATGTPSPHLPQDEDEQGQDKDAGQHGQQDDPPRHAAGHRRPRVQVDGDGNLGRGGWSGGSKAVGWGGAGVLGGPDLRGGILQHEVLDGGGHRDAGTHDQLHRGDGQILLWRRGTGWAEPPPQPRGDPSPSWGGPSTSPPTSRKVLFQRRPRAVSTAARSKLYNGQRKARQRAVPWAQSCGMG